MGYILLAGTKHLENTKPNSALVSLFENLPRSSTMTRL
jgi:hypothetical protein